MIKDSIKKLIEQISAELGEPLVYKKYGSPTYYICDDDTHEVFIYVSVHDGGVESPFLEISLKKPSNEWKNKKQKLKQLHQLIDDLVEAHNEIHP